MVLSGMKIHLNLVRNYNEDSDEGYFLECDVQHPENLHNIRNDLRLLPERVKTENVEQLVVNSYDKKICYEYKKFKTSTDSLASSEKANVKELRENAKNDSDKDFFKLINKAFFRKIMENVRNHRYIKLMTNE